jgi:ATP-dependent RNA helicase DeaD
MMKLCMSERLCASRIARTPDLKTPMTTANASGNPHPEHVQSPNGHAPAPAPVAPGQPIDLFDTSITFEQMGIRDSVLKGLTENKFKHPTKIQAMLIPPIMSGKDVIGQARTGTGKTGAFGIPLLHAIDKAVPYCALILVPTRELCVQVAAEINDLGMHTPLRAAAIYGGQRMSQQVDQLKRGVQIIVSTPGRLMDMIERGMLHLNNVKYAVLDEVDRMLDIGFRDDIRKILKMCPDERQTIFVSATLPTEVERLARTYSKDALKVIATYTGALTTETVKQFYLPVAPTYKKRLVLHLLKHEEPALTVIFCRTKRMVDELTRLLCDKGIDAHAMHGDMPQNKRTKVIESLRKGALGVLVASDLASRGLDIDGISHVINYDLPEDPEVYVHRIGRTARIGREGVAWSLVTPDQGELLTNIENLINQEIPKLVYPDFAPVAVPQINHAPPKPEQAKLAQVVATIAPPVAGPSAEEVKNQKFPGGIVPSKLPPNRLFGRGRGGMPKPLGPATDSASGPAAKA